MQDRCDMSITKDINFFSFRIFIDWHIILLEDNYIMNIGYLKLVSIGLYNFILD